MGSQMGIIPTARIETGNKSRSVMTAHKMAKIIEDLIVEDVA